MPATVIFVQLLWRQRVVKKFQYATAGSAMPKFPLKMSSTIDTKIATSMLDAKMSALALFSFR